MIIYGWKATSIGTDHPMDKCEHCGQQNCMEMHVFQKYAHVFWIPFFPIGKTGVSQCNHCKQVLKPNQMTGNTKLNYENLKQTAKSPFWVWSGAAVIAAFVLFSVSQGGRWAKEKAERVAHPKANDIFKIRLATGKYTIYKVDEVVGDTVYLLQNQYEADRSSGMRDLKNKPYYDSADAFLQSEINEMFKKGEIIDVDR
jgi:hypothetical protein